MKLYKHKTIARYRVGRFEFKKHRLALDDKDAEEFEKTMSNLPRRDQVQIVEVDPEAERRMERPLSRVVRGTMGSGKSNVPAKNAGPNRPQDSDLEEIHGKLAAEKQTNEALQEELKALKQKVADSEKAQAKTPDKAADTEKPSTNVKDTSKNDAGSDDSENFTTKVPASAPSTSAGAAKK